MVFSSNELDILILQNGKDGISADSKYTWVKYSQNSDGSNMTDDPTNAVYIGIAYNKDGITESENPNDYAWTLIKGTDGSDAYTIIMQNENITFSVDNNTNTVLSNQSFSSTIQVFQGTTERTDFTIGEVISENGITVTKQGKTINLSVNNGDVILADNGYFRIPISIDGLVFFKDITWNLAKQGESGINGEPALNIVIGNESQNIPCTSEGLVTDGFLIEIPFTGYKGFEMINCSVSVGVLPDGITLGSNTPSTSTSEGIVILNVAKNATLGGGNVLCGKVILTFTIDNQSIIKYFSWTKTKDGAEGSMTLYELQSSSPVLSKNYDGTLSPAAITFNSYYRQSSSANRYIYTGMFIIRESEDGVTYTNKYVSSVNESSVIYTPSSNGITNIRCILCESDNISLELDTITIPILTNIDNIKPIITEIKTNITNIETQVDNNTKSITDKVWSSDINTAIDNYDGTTVKTLKDTIATHTVTIGNITDKVSSVESILEIDENGNAIQTLKDQTAQMVLDAEQFQTTVSSTYAKKQMLKMLLTKLK